LALSDTKAYLFSIGNRAFASHKDDFGFVRQAFIKNKIEVVETLSLPEVDKAFVVLSGSDLTGLEEFVSERLQVIKKIVLFITSDECGTFNVDKIKHPDIKIWKQYPYPKHKKYFKMPLGAPIMLEKNMPEYSQKNIDLFFAGQITHQRRQELGAVMDSLNTEHYLPTAGFMQGSPSKDYYAKVAKAKVVPAPAGSATIDSFRFYEALELLAMPIGDTKNSSGEDFDYWDYVFEQTVPFPKTNDWNSLPSMVDQISSEYPANMHKVVAWWIKYKRDFCNKIMEQINEH
jgi:hypothetical protein